MILEIITGRPRKSNLKLYDLCMSSSPKKKAEEAAEVRVHVSSRPPRKSRAATEMDDAATRARREKWAAEKRKQRKKWDNSKWNWHRKKVLEAYHKQVKNQKSSGASVPGLFHPFTDD